MPTHSLATIRLARTVRYCTLPVLLLGLVGLFTPLVPDSRALMCLYLTGLCVTLSSLIVECGARLQLSIHQAFRAGYQTGQHHQGHPQVPQQRGSSQPDLRVVD
jgi:hypothetical protein